jgi:adenylate cyclase
MIFCDPPGESPRGATRKLSRLSLSTGWIEAGSVAKGGGPVLKAARKAAEILLKIAASPSKGTAMSGLYRFDRFVLDTTRGCVRAGNEELNLRPKSFELLRYLAENAGRLASKDELVAVLWPDVFVSDDSLAQCVRDIRAALGDEERRIIKTVPKRGYIFVAEVAREDGPEEGPAARRGARPYALGALAAVLVLAAGLAAWTLHRAPNQPSRLSIAILPFTAAETSGDRLFGEGLTEDITAAVARFRDIAVISRSASFRYGRDSPDPSAIGQRLGARYLLQGSVRRAADQLRVTVQLVEAQGGEVAWAERYERPVADVFAIQDEIVDQIARRLIVHSRLSAAERLHHRPANSLEAYELVLRARQAFRAFSRDSAIEARALIERAVALDPNSSSAWDLLARILTRAYIVPWGASYLDIAVLERARDAALTAIRLDPANAVAHAALGYALVWLRDYERGLGALRTAIALNPNDAEVYRGYADALGFSGDHEGSLAAFARAQELDPFSPPIVMALSARAHNMLGRYEQALPLARTCAERAATLPACFLNLAVAAQGLGQMDVARRAVEQLIELNPRTSVTSQLQLVQFRSAKDTRRYAEGLRRAGFPE